MAIEIHPSPESAPLPDDATARLMRMLDSVRLEKSAAPTPEEDSATCPNCHSDDPWQHTSWCRHCRYNPQLGRVMTLVETQIEEGEKPRARSYYRIWLAASLLMLIVLTILARSSISTDAARGTFGRIQFLIGIGLILMGQVRAYITLNRGTKALPLSSILLEPVQLWQAAFRQLPETQHVLFCGVMGLASVTLAVSAIGLNLDGMFGGLKQTLARKWTQQADEYTDSLRRVQVEMLAAGALETDSSDSESDPEAEPAELNTAASINATTASPFSIPLSPSGQDRAERTHVVIFGYLTNPAGEMRSVLLAEIGTNHSRFAARLPLDELPESSRRKLQDTLDQIRTRRAALNTSYHARWVRPLITAEIAHVGRTPEGFLRDGYLVTFDASQVNNITNLKQAGRN